MPLTSLIFRPINPKVYRESKDGCCLRVIRQNAIKGEMQSVSTPWGDAELMIDGHGADVLLKAHDAMVHMRRGGGAGPEGRSG